MSTSPDIHPLLPFSSVWTPEEEAKYETANRAAAQRTREHAVRIGDTALAIEMGAVIGSALPETDQ